MSSSEIQDYVMDDEAVQMFGDDMVDVQCLQTRKWWCFLLSSICTFLMGIFSVLFVRAFAAIFCRKVNKLSGKLFPVNFVAFSKALDCLI